MKNFNVEEVFDRYNNNDKLEEADIFHLYDTGDECITDNSGYHDSRHFKLVIFNTKTMEKRTLLGRHDGITSTLNNHSIDKVRIYADGSFFFKLKNVAKLGIFQCIHLE